MKNFIVRTITGIIFVAAIVSCFLRPEAMVLLFSIITGLTVWEFTGLVNERDGVTVNRLISTVAAVYFFYAMTYYCSDMYAGIAKSVVFIPYLVTIVYLLVAELYLKQKDPIQDWAYTMLAQMYIALPFSLINVLAFNATSEGFVSFNTLLPLSIFVFLWVNDSGAYIGGSLFGKHKMWERHSPGKTWEGTAFGVTVAILLAVFIGPLLTDIAWYHWLALGIICSVVDTLGDLVESMLKRSVGVKDSGNIMPGHGGFLDRFDSLLISMPFAYVYLTLVV